ncbi:MAG: hypothetical protein HDT18_10395 [Oscillibacter sp.]|nr:hypothetical protein [Oscillibacter sp.]
MSERKRKFAMLGGLCGAVYLIANRLLPSLPDVLMGVVLGLGLVFFVAAMVPEKSSKKAWKWKRRGE